MKNIAVLKSKLIMPQLPNCFVMSEYVKKLSKDISTQQAIIIHAPAGYGKTSFIVASLSLYDEKNTRICWYRLEQEDINLSVFYSNLIETLFPASEEKWDEIHRCIDEYGDIQSQHQYINATICKALWEFHRLHSNINTFIVFDDFHLIQDSAEICETIRYFTNNLPDACCVIISSRCKTEIITVKQQLKMNVLEITDSELCFSEKDLAKLVSKVYKTKLEHSLIRKIISYTEGWTAGIVIMCQLLNNRSPHEISSMLDYPVEKELLFRYFVEEVLSINDWALIMFLVKLAILHDFSVQQASIIFGIDDTQKLLEECERKGMFIQKCVSKNVLTYRLHGLFREVLLQLQHRYLNEEEITSYHMKAAAFYIDNKIFDRAIEHFVVCGSIKPAVDLITKEVASLGPYEALDNLRLWFNLLPLNIVENNGILLYIKSYIYQKGETDALILLEKALEIFKKDNHVIMQLKTYFSIVHFYVFRNNAANIIHVLDQIQILLTSSDGLVTEGILSTNDLLKDFWQEEYSKAIISSNRANSFDLMQDWKWLALVYSCQLHYLLGDLEIAESFINEAFRMNLVKKTEMLKCFALMFQLMILHLKKDDTIFCDVKDELLEISEKYNFLFVLGIGKKLEAINSYCKHDSETAYELLDASNKYFQRLGNTAMHQFNNLHRCLWLSDELNAKELLKEGEKCFRSLEFLNPGQCIIEIGQSLLGALAREAGEYEFAEKILLDSIKTSKSKNTKQVLCSTCLHLAKLYYDMGDAEKGEAYLAKAMHIASTNKYVMFWAIHLPTIIEMSIQCIKNGLFSEYALLLIEKYFCQDACDF
ncbi:hypothetical protein [Petroclostridium sp. X23]|uniref:hypothetical protein n=1 Tax=Petroclostridium sp. X23 TaxID=3045146 RepID=UPI0024AD645F|nr:hypothetical protein [Petroclostridium sp. X23]WHH56931.1 hypothetical protein QKW49_13840 [Petroclostridium sp. X23]